LRAAVRDRLHGMASGLSLSPAHVTTRPGVNDISQHTGVPMTTQNRLRASLIGAMLMLLLPQQAIWAVGPPSPPPGNLSAAVADLQAQVTALQTQVGDLQTQNSALQNQVNALQTQVNSLQPVPASIVAIAPYLSLQTVNGYPTVRFSGVNVQLVNGMESTATVNGLGNLIVGYDEADTSGIYHCTLGMYPDYPHAPIVDASSCIDAGGSWVNTGFKTGSHYLVLGSGNNYSRWGGLIAGYSSTSNYDYASVSGGLNNTASGSYSSVSGGAYGIASGSYSSVSGGANNTASGTSGSVSGGYSNYASGTYSSVSGGRSNIPSGTYSSVSGGRANTAGGDYSSVSGGQQNAASGNFTSILGGPGFYAPTDYQTIPSTSYP